MSSRNVPRVPGNTFSCLWMGTSHGSLLSKGNRFFPWTKLSYFVARNVSYGERNTNSSAKPELEWLFVDDGAYWFLRHNLISSSAYACIVPSFLRLQVQGSSDEQKITTRYWCGDGKYSRDRRKSGGRIPPCFISRALSPIKNCTSEASLTSAEQSVGIEKKTAIYKACFKMLVVKQGWGLSRREDKSRKPAVTAPMIQAAFRVYADAVRRTASNDN